MYQYEKIPRILLNEKHKVQNNVYTKLSFFTIRKRNKNIYMYLL